MFFSWWIWCQPEVGNRIFKAKRSRKLILGPAMMGINKTELEEIHCQPVGQLSWHGIVSFPCIFNSIYLYMLSHLHSHWIPCSCRGTIVGSTLFKHPIYIIRQAAAFLNCKEPCFWNAGLRADSWEWSGSLRNPSNIGHQSYPKPTEPM